MKRWFHKIDLFYKTVWPAIAWSVLILVIQMIPEKNLPRHNHQFAKDQIIPVPFFDKFIHLLFYSVLTILWLIWLSKKKIITSNFYRQLMVVSVIFLYGVMIEYLQTFVGREFNYNDVSANLFGVFSGIIFISIIKNPESKIRD